MEVITLVISVPGFAATMFAIGSTFSALIVTLTEEILAAAPKRDHANKGWEVDDQLPGRRWT